MQKEEMVTNKSYVICIVKNQSLRPTMRETYIHLFYSLLHRAQLLWIKHLIPKPTKLLTATVKF